MSNDEGCNENGNIVSLVEPLLIPTADAGVGFMAKPTYRLYIWEIRQGNAYPRGPTWYWSWWQPHRLCNYPPEWENSAKKESLPIIWPATKPSRQIEDFVMRHLRLGDLYLRVWLGIAQKIVVNMLLATGFIGRFICGIFPSDRKVVP